MWQVLLAAAVAGSGFYAKRFLHSDADPNIIVSEEIDTQGDQFKGQEQHFDIPSKPHGSIPPEFEPRDGYNCSDCEMQSSTAVGDGDRDREIFRFSCSGYRVGTGSQFGSKKVLKNWGDCSSGNKGNVEGFKNKLEKKRGVFNQSKSGRKFSVCVKKRRTSKNAPGKCESCLSKDNSIFSWGLGVGIMYMMSTGKAEIGRLNTAMDETAKIVQELKTELSERKSSRNLNVFRSKAGSGKTGGINTRPISQSSTESVGDSCIFAPLVTEDGECASSVLTEDPQQEVLELDRLEAELESELQKISFCSTEDSGPDGSVSTTCKNDASAEGFYRPEVQNSNSYEFNGVLPFELDQKLSHLLIKQQENQIVGLESELHQSQSKLGEKEAELQALKDCVRRLTEFSLATPSDDESEARMEEEETNGGDYSNKMGPESHRSVVGMKRAMDFESFSCH